MAGLALKIEVSAGMDEDELERALLDLRHDLMDLSCVEAVERAQSVAPSSAKSPSGTELGILIATISGTGTVIRYVTLCLRDWLRRNSDKRIRVNIDDKLIDVSGLSEQAIVRILQDWYSGRQ